MGRTEKESLYSEYLNYIYDLLEKSEGWPSEEKNSIYRDAAVLKEKLYDDDLYLGVIGAFSSGKSTFINSMLRKNLLPTDAVQGTTVSAAILKRASKNDLEIVYANEKKRRYSMEEKQLRCFYKVNDPETSFFQKIIRWIITHFFKFTAAFRRIRFQRIFQLFSKLITDDAAAGDIAYVSLELEGNRVGQSIAIVDTPGTESLTPRHAAVTKYAIDSLCDAVVVIIPYDTPVAQSLVDYLRENLADQLSNLIFVVTKVELLGDLDELDRLMKVIEKRLERGLGIQSPVVVPIPTLFYLENIDLDMQKSGLFTDFSEQKKQTLLDMYQKGYSEIYSVLEEKRNLYIRDKLYSISRRIQKQLRKNIEKDLSDYESRLSDLQSIQIPDPDETVQEMFQTVDGLQRECGGRHATIVLPVHEEIDEFTEMASNAIRNCSSASELVNMLSDLAEKSLAQITERPSITAEANRISSAFKDLIVHFAEKFKGLYYNCAGADPVCDLSRFNFDWTTLQESVQTLSNNYSSALRVQVDAIQNRTKGFFNRLKSVLFDPLPELKEKSIVVLREQMELWNTQAASQITALFEKYEAASVRTVKEQVHGWVARYGDQIRSEIHQRNSKIVQFEARREDALKNLSRLQQYIKSFEEESV